jgi:hypothetical protein
MIVNLLWQRLFDRKSLNKRIWGIHNRVIDRRFGKSKGWGGFYLHKEDLSELTNSFNLAKEIKINLDHSPQYVSTDLKTETLEKLNSNNCYRNGFDLIPEIERFNLRYRENISEIINSPYRIVNIRAWEMLPRKNAFGPSDYHDDGFEKGHMKIMIYLSHLNSETGTVQFKDEPPLERDAGFVLVFQNSDLIHRAIPGLSQSRNLIEITVQRLARDLKLKSITGFCNDRHLKKPSLGYRNF